MIKTFKVLTSGIAICALMLSTQSFGKANPELSDPEVAHVAVTANQIDISYAEIARKKSKNTEVLKFAETMARDHKAIIAKAAALAKKLGVTPADNAVSKQLMSDAEKTKTMLNSKSGKAFDKAYIDNEVAYHKAVINAVENLLIPETENAELKKLLEDVIAPLKAHLAHAEMVQKNFK